jgi:hypothetical protein
MTTDYAVQINEEQLEELRRRMEIWGANTDLALARAINSTANKVRSSRSLPGGKKGASQQIIARYDIEKWKKADRDFKGGTNAQFIKHALRIYGANRHRLRGKIYGKKRAPLLSHFSKDTGVPPTPETGVTVDVLGLTGSRQVGRIRGTVSKPFYVREGWGNMLLIVGRKPSGKLKAARTIGIGQMFNWIKDDMQDEIQEEFEKQLMSKVRELLTKLKVPMEDPGD